MTRYFTAALSGVVFAFTGHPSGIRLLAALAVTNLTIWVWGRITEMTTNEAEA